MSTRKKGVGEESIDARFAIMGRLVVKRREGGISNGGGPKKKKSFKTLKDRGPGPGGIIMVDGSYLRYHAGVGCIILLVLLEVGKKDLS